MPGEDNSIETVELAAPVNTRPPKCSSTQVPVVTGATTVNKGNTASPKNKGGKGKGGRQTIAGLSVVVRQQGARVESLDHEIKSTNRTVHSIESNLENFMRSFEDFKSNFSRPVLHESQASNSNDLSVDSVQQQVPLPEAGPAPAASVAQPRDLHQQPALLPAPARMPTPAAMVREENRHGNLDTLVAREEFKTLPTNGKPTGKDSEFVKPYFYLERAGIQTTKQKLDLRASMSLIG